MEEQERDLLDAFTPPPQEDDILHVRFATLKRARASRDALKEALKDAQAKYDAAIEAFGQAMTDAGMRDMSDDDMRITAARRKKFWWAKADQDAALAWLKEQGLGAIIDTSPRVNWNTQQKALREFFESEEAEPPEWMQAGDEWTATFRRIK